MSSRRALLLVPLLVLATTGATAPPAPRRIVSLNLCADQYLLALADRSQIAALTRFARDPRMSAMAAEARGVPAIRGSAEDVLALSPDLVIAYPGHQSTTKAALAGYPVRSLGLPSAESYTAIVAQIRDVSRAIGHPDRGEAMIRRMEAALARLPDDAGRGRVAAQYQRRGFLTGTGTLIDDLFRRVGLVNLATRLGRPALSRLSLEQMIAARPDFILTETSTDRVQDEGTEMLHHPILDGIPRLHLPQAWTVCGGPAYVLAAESLVRQMQARRR